MTHDKFEALVKELDGDSAETLIKKNRMYSSEDDALHNFNDGGEVFGGTPADACWGYLTKHLVALRDMVKKNDFSNREDFKEKCQDSINYIRILWAIGNDQVKKRSSRYPCGSEWRYNKDFVFNSSQEAYDVLSNMKEILAIYGKVTIADMYDIIGRCVSPLYQYARMGWTDLSSAMLIEHDHPEATSTYTIHLPDPKTF